MTYLIGAEIEVKCGELPDGRCTVCAGWHDMCRTTASLGYLIKMWILV